MSVIVFTDFIIFNPINNSNIMEKCFTYTLLYLLKLSLLILDTRCLLLLVYLRGRVSLRINFPEGSSGKTDTRRRGESITLVITLLPPFPSGRYSLNIKSSPGRSIQRTPSLLNICGTPEDVSLSVHFKGPSEYKIEFSNTFKT